MSPLFYSSTNLAFPCRMSLACDPGHELVTQNVTTVVYSQSAINPQQIIASPSHTLEDSSAGIRKYIQDINSEVANTSICPTIIVKQERLPLNCKSCDYKTFHKHALDRHIQSVHVKVKFYLISTSKYSLIWSVWLYDTKMYIIYYLFKLKHKKKSYLNQNF